MHPGPMIRGLEITSDVADGPQSVIEQQVRNGVAIRMALIHRALEPVQPVAGRKSAPVRAAKRLPAKKRGGS
jgi:aspartate carbamoyltransferase catalytic subunit